MARNGQLFAAVGQAYGVDPYILGAIWGMETDYGAVLGNDELIRPIVRSLATLVHQRRTRLVGGRGRPDRGAATGAARAARCADRWSAPGPAPSGICRSIHPMWWRMAPMAMATGAVDLHNSLADALATSARFLRGLGYQPGVDWGMEVVVPEGFDYLLATRTQMRPVSFFAERGMTRVAGRQFADPNLPVFLYVPAGKDGPKFLMTQNYLVLKGYNFSDSYAMSVAHMTDRLKGGGGFVDDWPRNTAFPNLGQRKAIQQALIAAGPLSGGSRWSAGADHARRPMPGSRRRAARWRTGSSPGPPMRRWPRRRGNIVGDADGVVIAVLLEDRVLLRGMSMIRIVLSHC